MDIRILIVEDTPTRNSPNSPGIILTVQGTGYLLAPRQVPCH